MPAATLPSPRPAARRQAAERLARAERLWRQGVELARHQHHEEAVTRFEQALKLHPHESLYWLNLSRSQSRCGRHDAALDSAREAWRLDPASLLACKLLSDLLATRRLRREQLAVLERLDPAVARDVDWHMQRGAALLATGEHQPAIRAYLDALASPDCTLVQREDVLMRLGWAFSSHTFYAEATQCYRTVLDLRPAALGAALYAAHYSAWTCDWNSLQSDMDRLADCIALLRDDPAQEQHLPGLSPFCLITLTDDPALLRWAAELACRRQMPQRAARPAGAPLPRHDGRLRIGLLSSDFHHHATSMLIAEVLESLDRSRFELVLYSGGPDDGSELRQRVTGSAVLVRETAECADAELAEQIRQDGIAVLIDLKGYTRDSRLGMMARRPAPLQVAWLGYPGTCGADFIDYVIGDPIVTPIEAQADFTEQIAQMPFCYQPNDSLREQPAPMSRADCGLPEGTLVFASFNQEYKIIPAVFDAWCAILRQVPDSVLWLLVRLPVAQQRLKEAAARHGIDPERLIFAPFMPIEQHRARLPNADLFLDTFPCSGHTTASDALWAGVPLLTLAGQGFASRVAASLLDTLGLPELVCTTLDDYIELAVGLARQPSELQALRQRLAAARTESPAFDGRQYARDLEALLLRMVERHEAGLAPAPLPAAAPQPALPR